MTEEWADIDAVLFECVARRGRSNADLTYIIYEADYINRMVYHRAEMETALRKLLGSGLIVETERGFSVTRSGKAVRKAAPRGSVYERMEWIREHVDDRVSGGTDSEWTLSSDAYESALAQYRSEMRAAIKPKR